VGSETGENAATANVRLTQEVLMNLSEKKKREEEKEKKDERTALSRYAKCEGDCWRLEDDGTTKRGGRKTHITIMERRREPKSKLSKNRDPMLNSGGGDKADLSQSSEGITTPQSGFIKGESA